MRRIFHLEIKSENSHKYYGSLSALVEENIDIGLSKFKVDRYDFSKPYENEKVIIRKSFLKTKSQVLEK